MDLLKAAQKKAAELGNEVQKQAAELQQNASALASDALSMEKKGERCVTFEQGLLGFEYDGAIVIAVATEGQAAQQGVQVGDRIVAISGYPVPKARSASDTAGEKRAKKEIKQWLDELVRPGNVYNGKVTFASAVSCESDASQASELEVGTSMTHQSLDAAKSSQSDLDTTVGSQDADPVQRQHSTDGTACENQSQGVRAVDDQIAALKAELRIVQEHSLALENELDEARAECQELRHLAGDSDDGLQQNRFEVQVRHLQQQLVAKKDELEAMRRQASDSQAKLSESNARHADLQMALSHNEQIALETSEGREQVLEDEVARLRHELSRKEVDAQASLKSVEEALAAAKDRTVSLEARTTVQDHDLKDQRAQNAAKDSAVRELHKLREEHVAVIAELREDRDQTVHTLQQQEQRTARELEDQKARFAELQASVSGKAREKTGEEGDDDDSNDDEAIVDSELVKAVAASLEAIDANDEEAPIALAFADGAANNSGVDPNAAAKRDDVDVAALYERIEFLESRCAVLKKKVMSRPIVCQAYKPAGNQDNVEAGLGVMAQALPWEPQLRATLGPVASSYVVRAQAKIEQTLRRFTERLLQNRTWLWLFYGHVFILYTLMSSCSVAETAAATGNPADALGKTLAQKPGR